MTPPADESPSTPAALAKVPTGVQGFDEITEGGLPEGRVSLVAGGAGSGKTVFAMGFLVNGAEKYGEPGLFVSFEETSRDLETNFASQGFDLKALQAGGMLTLDHIRIERSEMEETGDYDLEGLFVRLGAEIDAIGARRVVLDTIEVLFSAFKDQIIIRAELKRLFQWLADRGVTAIVTGESGERHITRHGLEEYVADFVVVLNHLVNDETATRRLRIVKYRGSAHGTNEFSFLIDQRGISVLPISSMGLSHGAPTERVSLGIAPLDEMLGGQGPYRGSSVLVSGTAGTGKTSIAASFVDAACRRGEKALYFAFEESPDQIIRNMRSIGIDLEQLGRGRPAAHPRRAAAEHRPRDAPRAHEPRDRGVRPHGDRHRPDHQPHEHRHLLVHPRDPDAPHRRDEVARDHRALHEPDRGRRQRREHRGRHLVADGHLDPGEEPRGQGQAHQRPLRAQVARRGALQRDP